MSQIQSYPDSSFLRVFHAPRNLTAEESARLTSAMQAFLSAWASHEQTVTGTFELLHDRFLVVAANESLVPLSGCSKDSLVGHVRAIGQELGLELVHAPPICFRDGESIESVDRATFGELVEAGRVNGDTVVFDNTIHDVGAWKGGRWELAARDCWHGQAYELEATS